MGRKNGRKGKAGNRRACGGTDLGRGGILTPSLIKPNSGLLRVAPGITLAELRVASLRPLHITCGKGNVFLLPQVALQPIYIASTLGHPISKRT